MMLRGCLFFLMFVGIFDPADKLLGLKVPAFILCWLVFLVYYVLNPVKVKREVYLYIYLMLLIPVLSMFYFEVFLGGGQTAALILIKAQLFASLIFILVAAKIDIIPMICRILCLLALVIIGVKVTVNILPELLPAIQIFGSGYGILLIGDRTYADSSAFQQIYFVTSPLLLIPIAYYSDRAFKAGFFSRDSFLALLVTLAMILAGTRSNMVGPVIVLACVGFIHASSKVLYLIVGILSLLLVSLPFLSEMLEVFSLQEQSNSIKLQLIRDYAAIFNDPVSLIFGQGFGSYHFWEARGFSDFISEMSYLELIRIYGFVFASVMAGMVLYPIIFTMTSKRDFPNKASIVGFTAYMAIAAINPLIFSSLGMTLISAFMANIFRSREFSDVKISNKLSYNKSIGLA